MVLPSRVLSSTFSKTCAVLAVSFALVLPTYAEVRVYDESQGSDVDARLHGGKLEALPTLKIEQAPRREGGVHVEQPVSPQVVERSGKSADEATMEDIRKAKSSADVVLGPWEEDVYDLGHAQVFIDPETYSEDMAKSLRKIEAIEGLRVTAYMKQADTFGEIVHFTRGALLKGPVDISFKTDSKNRKFQELHMNNYDSIYYTSPFGDSREFPLAEPEYIINKVDIVRRQVRSAQ